MKRTAATWNGILIDLGVKPITAAIWSPIFAQEIGDDTFSLGDTELDDFLGNVLHESSMLERLEEGLYYKTPGRLMAIWPSRFTTLESELPYLRNPEALANKVYGGRMGNVSPGDGFLFRGRSLIQVTGRENYRALGQAMNLDLESNPDQLATPKIALLAAVCWWEGHVPDAVMGNGKLVRKAVNGGSIGLRETMALTDEAREALS